MGCANSQSIEVANAFQPIEEEYVPVKREMYSFDQIEDLLHEIEEESTKSGKHIKQIMNDKCRIVLYLVGLQGGIPPVDMQSQIRIRHRMRCAIESLDFVCINSIKACKRVSDIQMLILDAFCILFQRPLLPVQPATLCLNKNLNVPFLKPSYEFGKYINGPNFDMMKNMTNFDVDSLNGQSLELLEPLLREDWFNEENAGRISKANSALVRWVRSVCKLAQVRKWSNYAELRMKLEQVEKWIEGWMRKNVREVYLERLASRYGKLYVETVTKKKRECAICLNEDQTGEFEFVITNCGHSFHKECLTLWMRTKQQCPFDRSAITNDKIMPFPDFD